MAESLDTPLRKNWRPGWMRSDRMSDVTGRAAESIARFSGTPAFLIWLTIFVVVWIGWNSLAPETLQFDKKDLGFTALTLMLSLQASYAAPLILLAQNRQDDRDRVTAEQDRQRAERNLADTEYLTREIASLRLALNDVATRDFVRSELRDMLEEILIEERKAREELVEELVEELSDDDSDRDSAAENSRDHRAEGGTEGAHAGPPVRDEGDFVQLDTPVELHDTAEAGFHDIQDTQDA